MEKCEYLFCSGNFPFKWGMAAEMGKLYSEMGIFISAFEMYNDVEMWEEAIKCCYMGGRESQAKHLCEKILNKTEN